MSRPGGGARAAGGGEASRLQAEMLQLDLIDAAGDAPAEEQTAPEPLQKEPPAGTTDVYRPKRPTTLNLFPQVPRSQVRPSRGGSGRAGRGVRVGGGMLPLLGAFVSEGWREKEREMAGLSSRDGGERFRCPSPPGGTPSGDPSPTAARIPGPRAA